MLCEQLEQFEDKQESVIQNLVKENNQLKDIVECLKKQLLSISQRHYIYEWSMSCPPYAVCNGGSDDIECYKCWKAWIRQPLNLEDRYN